MGRLKLSDYLQIRNYRLAKIWFRGVVKNNLKSRIRQF